MADNGLPAFVDMDLFDRDLLLTFAPVPIQHRVGARKPLLATGSSGRAWFA